MSIRYHRTLVPAALSLSAVALAQRPTLDLSLDPEFSRPDVPAVTIEDHANRTTEEYRVNGNLYMIKVKPAAGPAYYLVDADGSGEFEWRRNTPNADLNVPQWALVQW